MSDTPVKVVIDLNKPEGQRESIIPLSPEEIAEREIMAAEFEADRLAQEQAEAEREAARAAAKEKLAALGLTPEEIAAITGA
jgi:hypothetical protein